MNVLPRHLGRHVLLLALCQGLMMTANSLLIGRSALIGLQLAANKTLATLPLAMQLLSSMMVGIPASLLMRQIRRRPGVDVGQHV